MAVFLNKKIMHNLNHLNGYSWSLMAAFISAALAMEYDSGARPFEGFFMSLPVMVLVMFWSEREGPKITIEDLNLSKAAAFNRDLFVITFSFILAGLLSLCFQYNNSDARGWWPLYVYFISLCGFLFAAAFSFIALMLSNHKPYLIVFSSVIIALISISKFWPRSISVLFIGEVSTFSVVMCSLISIHFLIFVGYKLFKFLHGKTSMSQ